MFLVGDQINVYERGRLLPNCPMVISKVSKMKHEKYHRTFNAIDSDGYVRVIDVDKFKVEKTFQETKH